MPAVSMRPIGRLFADLLKKVFCGDIPVAATPHARRATADKRDGAARIGAVIGRIGTRVSRKRWSGRSRLHIPRPSRSRCRVGPRLRTARLASVAAAFWAGARRGPTPWTKASR